MGAAPPAGMVVPVLSIDRASAKPLYRQIYEGFRNAIVERRLHAGQRISSTRSLAAELRISRIPVLNAFDQLLAEGYVESRTGSGTFVAASLPDGLSRPALRAAGNKAPLRFLNRVIARRPEALLKEEPDPWLKGIGPFNVGQPPVDRFPVRVWSRLVARHSRRLDASLLHYGNPMGLPRLREAVAAYLRAARAVRCEAEQIMIVSGSQQALELSARVLLDEDSPVWVEEPGYFGARKILALSGARLVPVPVDDQGLDVSSGIRRFPRPRAVFVTPSHQFPLGVTMGASRRLQLLDWARHSGSWIIEDDYDSEYRYGNLPIASLQGLDRDSRVLYVGTFTKIVFPSIRLGYIVLPPDLVAPFTEVRRAMDMSSPTFPQAVLADFILDGHFTSHIRRTRQLCRERRDALIEAIRREFGRALQVLGDEAGMFLVLTLPAGWSDREIALSAAREGLWVAPLSDFYLERAARQGLVLGYGGTKVEDVGRAVEHLRGVIEACGKTRGRRPARGITASERRARGGSPRS